MAKNGKGKASGEQVHDANKKGSATTSALAVIGAMDSEDALLASLEKGAKGDATGEQVREQMGSVEPRLEKIEIKHAGTCALELPGGELVQGEKGITCVIVASNFHNAFYEHAYDDPDREADERPICKSSDGVSIDPDSAKPQSSNCSVCPLNCAATSQQARDIAFTKERGERCQNRLSLVVTLPGHALPYIVQLSPRSFKHFANYAQRVGSLSRFLLHEVATRITLKKAGQFGHSEAQFANLGALPAGLRAAYEEAHETYLAYLRRTATFDRVDDAEEKAKSSAGEESTPAEEAPL